MKTDLTQHQRALLQVYNKGYRVERDGTVQSFTGREIKVREDTRGYLVFTASIEMSHHYSLGVHYLLAYQKFGDKLLEDNMETRHLDGNKKNNSWNNIGIGTHKENMMDRSEEARIEGAKSANEKVTDEQALKIRERVKNNNHDSYKKLAAEYGLKSKSSIHYIVHDKRILED